MKNKKMKNNNAFLGIGQGISICLMLMLFSITVFTLSSCGNEDDIPPPSAYVPPTPDTTGACVFLNVVPSLTSDEVLDFECEGPAYETFGDINGTITITYVENPDMAGINLSDKVVEVIQSGGVEPWAGFFFDLSEKIDLSVFQGVKVKVYSPAVGQVVNLKLEDSADGSISSEVSVMTTVANEWEELTFTFSSGDTEKYDRFVLFFNFQGDKDSETFHYFDDIILGEGGVIVVGPDLVPSVAAPIPSTQEDKVISLFSNAYTDVPVDTWRTDWSAATLVDTMIQGDDVKKYAELSFVGVETVTNQVDASSMTHFHTDIWTGNATTFRIKLVDFGPNGTFDDGGGDDSEHELEIENPALEEWVSLDIALADFTGLTMTGNIAQFIYSAAPASQATVFMDNVYFYDITGVVLGPAVAAPTPSFPEMNVISMFSDAYSDVLVDTWRTDWSVGELEDTEVQGDAIKKYSALNFVGIETVSNQVDASLMSHFHTDIWTANATTFRIKLVDFGPNGAFDNGGVDDSEHEIVIENPMQLEWVSLDLQLADFTGLTNTTNIAQLIFSGLPSGAFDVFVDNVYFHNNMEPATEPAVAAPTPTLAAANVISMFSDAYTDIPVDTWRTEWSSGDLEDTEVQGDAIKKYSALNFVGIETVSNQVDVSSMTHFHTNIWTANATTFRIKLVDFGPNGAFDNGGVDDSEHEIVIENPTQQGWISLDLPLADFIGLTNTTNISQLIFSGLPSGEIEVFVDNVYFHN